MFWFLIRPSLLTLFLVSTPPHMAGNNDMLNLTSKMTLDAKMRVKSDIFAGWEEEIDHQVCSSMVELRGSVGSFS